MDSGLSGVVLAMLRSTVLKRAGFDIELVNPIEHAESCVIPALFAFGSDDTFVRGHHSSAMAERYKGHSFVYEFTGDHYSTRPRQFYNQVQEFLQAHLLTWRELPTHPDGTKVARANLRSNQIDQMPSSSHQHDWLNTTANTSEPKMHREQESFLTQLLSCFDSDPRQQDTADDSAQVRTAQRRAAMRPDR